MAATWTSVPVAEVEPGTTVRLHNGMELLVSRVEQPFLGRDNMVAFIEDTSRRWYKAPMPVDGATERVGCSIGISVYPDDADSAEKLIANADRAMYAAKSGKGRRYAYFAA